MEYWIEYRVDDTGNKPQRKKNEGEDKFMAVQKKAYNRCPCLRCGQRATCQQPCAAFENYVK